jgi:hypothetical protein
MSLHTTSKRKWQWEWRNCVLLLPSCISTIYLFSCPTSILLWQSTWGSLLFAYTKFVDVVLAVKYPTFSIFIKANFSLSWCTFSDICIILHWSLEPVYLDIFFGTWVLLFTFTTSINDFDKYIINDFWSHSSVDVSYSEQQHD